MMQYPGQVVQPQPKSFTCHEAAILTVSVFGYLCYIASIGMSGGFCFGTNSEAASRFNGFLVVATNAAYILFTCEILDIIFGSDGQLSADDLRRLRSMSLKLMAASLTGLGVSIATVIHGVSTDFRDGWRFSWYDPIARYSHDFHFYNYDAPPFAMGCSFNFILSFTLAILAGTYHAKQRRLMKLHQHTSAPTINLEQATTGKPLVSEQVNQAFAYPGTTIGMPFQRASTPAMYPKQGTAGQDTGF